MDHLETTPKHYYKIDMEALEGSGHAQADVNNRTVEFRGFLGKMGFPWWLSSKESSCNAVASGDEGLIPVSGRSPGGGHSNPLQYSCLENPVNKGDW